MNTLSRGIRNTFRNGIRTFGIIVILGLSIGLSLTMLLARQAVQSKIDSVKSSIGNTITVNPAGAQGFQGGGEPLTEDQMTSIRTIPHVSDVTENLQDRLTAGTDNNLVSAIDAGTLGNRNGRQSQRQFSPPPSSTRANTTATPQTFSVPITVTGISDASLLTTGTNKLSTGTLFDVNSTANVAIIGSSLATKNNLAVGGTFTAYGQTITVQGIYEAGNAFENAGMYVPIKTLQTLSDQANNVSSATITVDGIEQVDSVVSTIQSTLGANKVDVTSNKAQATQALTPLENIKTISTYSLFGSLGAGAIIILLTMMMIVRERRREIGVLKAIGASNISIMIQFITESVTFTLIGSVIGFAIGILGGNPMTQLLINNAATSATPGTPQNNLGRAGGQFARVLSQSSVSLQNIHTTIGWNFLLYGLGAAVIIAIIGSAIPAWLIAKIRPAEVMRTE